MTTATGSPEQTHAEVESRPGVDRRHRPADFIHERTNFHFMRHRRRMLFVFVGVVIVSLLALSVRDLNLGLDFEGGVSWQVEVAGGRDASVAEIRDGLAGTPFADAKVTTTRNAQDGTTTIRVQSEEIPDDPVKQIRDSIAEVLGVEPADVTADITGSRGSFSVSGVDQADQAAIESALAAIDGVDATVTVTPTLDAFNVGVVIEDLPESPRDEVTAVLADYAGQDVREVSINTVGPTWGDEVSRKALYALLLFFLVLAVYLSLRFEFKMAASAIVAVIHDIIFTVGVYAIVGFEVTPATVTAFLTILGFSLYDTVVVFDKIKENTVSVGGRVTYADMVDRSLNQVLMRSLSTSLVALLPVFSLLIIGSFVLGATALEDFALALLAGLFIGTYSSIFVAAPMLCAWKEREPQYRAVRERRDRSDAASGRATTRPTSDRAAGAPQRPVPATTNTATANTSGAVASSPATPSDWDTTGVPGPPAVGRVTAPRPRQPRGKKRR
jgi:preprotein translocase subunit SecF